MAVLQMQRMSICALKKDRKAILEKLQHMGVMEINHILEEDEDFQQRTRRMPEAASKRLRHLRIRRCTYCSSMLP